MGSTAQVTFRAFDAYNNQIFDLTPTFTIDEPSVAMVTPTGLLTSVSTGTTIVRALSGAVVGTAVVVVNTTVIDPCAGVTMTLAAGASQTLTGAAASQICVSGAAGAEFVAIPFFATGDTTQTAALSLTFTPLAANAAASGPPTPNVLANARSRESISISGRPALARDLVWESQFRARVRNELTPMLRRSRATRQGASPRLSIGAVAAVLPSVGDTLQLNSGATNGCSGAPQIHTATVQAVTTHAIVVSDNTNAPTTAGFTPADYAAIGNAFDTQVWTTDTDAFGPETDIDGNGRVILYFTQEVNKLTPPNSNSFVGGFFYGRDLIEKTRNGQSFCPGSNFAEMFYLLAPDPSGAVSNNVRSASFVKSITIGTVAHEFQHLINFGYHYWDTTAYFNGFESTFLDEGLSHIAEELNYYTSTHRSARSNLDPTVATIPTSEYVAYADQNAKRFREYLKNPDRYVPYSPMADTSLAIRGGIWSLLRYLADQQNGTVPEKTTWLRLVRPPSYTDGLTNLAAVFGADFLSKMRDWAVANYLDDAGTANTEQRFTNPSWNTRLMEQYVNGSSGVAGTTFPLKTTSLVGTSIRYKLQDGGAAYLRFAADIGAVGGATVAAPIALPASFSITVIRTK